MYPHLCVYRGKRMKQTVTQGQIDAHNDAIVKRIVAHQIWKQTSRMSTPTRNATWNRR